MNDRNRVTALDQLKRLTRNVTQRSVERLYEWTGQIPPQHQAAAQEAQSSHLTPIRALHLARYPHASVQVLLAQNPATHGIALTELSRADAPEVRGAIAAHPHCPAHTLHVLALDPIPSVARVACLHPSTPVSALEQAAGKPEQFPLILAAIAQHPQAPSDLLLRLSGRVHSEVSQAVARHPGAPPAALAALARNGEEDTLMALAARTDLGVELQQQLAGPDRRRCRRSCSAIRRRLLKSSCRVQTPFRAPSGGASLYTPTCLRKP